MSTSNTRATGETRTETDSLGELQVPAHALWGAQTQRAIENFPISAQTMPRGFIEALGLIKWAAADANAALDLLPASMSKSIQSAALDVAHGQHDIQFPVDVYQTGSGTSTNMNANEVIARLASEHGGKSVHPNNHVNMGQSSNDVIPTAIHLSACLAVSGALQPAIRHLITVLSSKGRELNGVVKTGRTHLMDAMPVTFDQELGAWEAQFAGSLDRLDQCLPRLGQLALGGTAVGTGINAHPDFAPDAINALAGRTGLTLTQAPSLFAALSGQEAALELSGILNIIASSLMKMANDLRWMNSGPLVGLGEIALPALQPGSSIMPGKVNPVLPEAAAMVAATVIGNHTTITLAAQSGNFQLNVMLPLVGAKLLESVGLLARISTRLADHAIAGFSVNHDRLDDSLSRNPILVTALNPVIGYELGAKVAKKAYETGRPVIEVALEMTDLDEQELSRLLDPGRLTRGGIVE